jgi:hypothetical protein
VIACQTSKLARSAFAILAAAVFALALPVLAQSPAAKPAVLRKLLPLDEGAADASWVQFRTWLLEALQRGDRKALVSILDANILNPLEAPRGIAVFRKIWDLDGKDERLMRELPVVMQLGSVWYQPKKGARLLCAPYVPIKWPLDDVDPYNSGAITVQETLVKDGPSHGAGTLGSLNYDIVAVRDWEVADKEERLQQRWVKIRHAGRDAYVPEEHIRSAIEYRACFAKTGAGWRMMEYVLGIEYLGG